MADEVKNEELVAAPVQLVREVVIDAIAAMRIMKHSNDNMPTLVAGALMGVDVDGVLEITYSLPFPVPKAEGEGASTSDAVEDMEVGEYQMEMMKKLRDVNMDNNCVGWYQSVYMGQMCTMDVVNYQFSYQSAEDISENSVVIMYDPTLSTQGDVVLKAFRLSQEFVQIKKQKLNKFIKASEILEELPLTIRTAGHAAGYLRVLADTHADALENDFGALSMLDSESFLEKHVDMIGTWAEYIVGEQQRFQQLARSNSKARQDQVRALAKRVQEAREMDEDPLKVRMDTLGFKPLDVPNRNDHLLLLAQMDKYCKQLNEHIGTSMHKLNLTAQLNSTH